MWKGEDVEKCKNRNCNSVIHFHIYTFSYSPILTFSISTGGEIRTPIKGFGDLYSAIELRPYLRIQIEPPRFSSAFQYPADSGITMSVESQKLSRKVRDSF